MSDPLEPAIDLTFTENPLDRASNARRDASWLKERVESESSRFLPFWKGNVLVKEDGSGLAWARGGLRESMDQDTGAVLLGLQDEVAHFAIDVSAIDEPERALGLAGVARFAEPRAAAGQLSGGEAGILAQGRSMIDWHARHRFCAACGQPTSTGDAGYQRECDECDAQHFPRTDPVAIMLVSDGERCLLGRQTGWPPGMWSALAGFVEPGETIEEAVRREVLEESGIQVGEVRYHASQPWPFPSSLMIGCLAEANSREITVDLHELADAQWFALDKVRTALLDPAQSNGFFVPPPMAIAHHLVRAWALQEA